MKKFRFFKSLSIIFCLILTLFSLSSFGCINYSDVINRISIDLMDSNVRIETRRMGMIPQGSTTDLLSGSGMVIAKDTDGYYYALTNYHVVEKGSFQYVEYHLTDYKGNRISEIGTALVSYSKDLDLAVIKFTSQNEYDPVKISKSKCNVDTPVFAIGSPNGQINTVTSGRILSLKKAPKIGDSKPLQNPNGDPLYVYCHSAYIYGGSSGGMLVNKNLELVGINYAGVTYSADNSFVEAYSIPTYLIVDFLSSLDFASCIDFVN